MNLVVGTSFLLTAMSGIYFLFASHGPGSSEFVFIFTRSTWDLIHTWAGVVLVEAVVIHFAIHWRWVVKVTTKLVQKFSQGSNQILRGRTTLEVNKSI